MRKFIGEFFRRGLCAMGFGPIVAAVVYMCLGQAGVVASLTTEEAARAIISTALMALIAGGMTAVYTVERLPVVTAALIHGAALYADYLLMYLVNDWFSVNSRALAIFTGIFVAGYAVIWLIIYLVNRRAAARLNRKLADR